MREGGDYRRVMNERAADPRDTVGHILRVALTTVLTGGLWRVGPHTDTRR